MADIIETAVEAGKFQTLIQALEAAELVDSLKQPGPFTVFAPVDAAFEQLPEGVLDQLLQDPVKLRKILAYHVGFGDVRAEDLAETNEVPTLEGSVLAVDTAEGYQVNQVRILQTDILADNGVIHIIDAVLMPAVLAGHS
jgi:uncharacterized surface protein with fasciclin (FAS1) repeats